jgi:hypothetical protein
MERISDEQLDALIEHWGRWGKTSEQCELETTAALVELRERREKDVTLGVADATNSGHGA